MRLQGSGSATCCGAKPTSRALLLILLFCTALRYKSCVPAEFWQRYVLWCEANQPEAAAAAVLARATAVHCKRRPDLAVFAARFHEAAGDADAARAAYRRVLSELAPGLLEVSRKGWQRQQQQQLQQLYMSCVCRLCVMGAARARRRSTSTSSSISTSTSSIPAEGVQLQ